MSRVRVAIPFANIGYYYKSLLKVDTPLVEGAAQAIAEGRAHPETGKAMPRSVLAPQALDFIKGLSHVAQRVGNGVLSTPATAARKVITGQLSSEAFPSSGKGKNLICPLSQVTSVAWTKSKRAGQSDSWFPFDRRTSQTTPKHGGVSTRPGVDITPYVSIGTRGENEC